MVMGSTRMQIISKVMLRESFPALVAAFTTTVVTLVGFSAMAGLIGGGGLGQLAYNYGFQRFDITVMIVTIVHHGGPRPGHPVDRRCRRPAAWTTAALPKPARRNAGTSPSPPSAPVSPMTRGHCRPLPQAPPAREAAEECSQ